MRRYRIIAKRIGGRRKSRSRISARSVAVFAALSALPLLVVFAAIFIDWLYAPCPNGPATAPPALLGK